MWIFIAALNGHHDDGNVDENEVYDNNDEEEEVSRQVWIFIAALNDECDFEYLLEAGKRKI